jgi:acyl-coenzyme A thioesterase PaaI-like protein
MCAVAEERLRVLAREVPLGDRTAVVDARTYGDDVPDVIAALCRMCP